MGRGYIGVGRGYIEVGRRRVGKTRTAELKEHVKKCFIVIYNKSPKSRLREKCEVNETKY